MFELTDCPLLDADRPPSGPTCHHDVQTLPGGHGPLARRTSSIFQAPRGPTTETALHVIPERQSVVPPQTHAAPCE